MKLKARDIVPGWPKPRSTSCWSFDAFDCPWQRGPEVRVIEFALNCRYHEAQQRMVTEHLELWRLNLKCFNCGHRYYAADADTAACPKCGNLAMMMWLRPIATA